MSKTADKLAAQWTEDTGRHFLDSGGHMGRNWERNQGKIAEDFLAKGSAYVDDWGVYINTFAMCESHLTYDDTAADLTAQFREWVDTIPEGDAYYNTTGSFEEFLETVLDVHRSTSFNTYNFETHLDSVLQGVDFQLDGTQYTALSYHGGADVRGGYTDLVVYRSCTDWPWSGNIVTVWCEACDITWDTMYDAWSFRVSDTYDEPTEFPEGKCPHCSGELKAEAYNDCSD